MQSSISILIPTQGRLVQLQRLLDGLAGLEDRERIPHEIIIVNNARDESSVTAVEAMVQKHSVREPGRWLHLRELEPGKSRALNSAIPRASGSILAFLDDDVEVAPSWLRVTWDFFEKYPYDVKQGSIRIPPAMQDDQRFLELLQRFRTICYYQLPGLEVRQIGSLNAANIALKRELLDRTGLFDVRIGPGTSGTSMDVEFGERVQRCGGRIGYEPRSVVYHDIDWSRLTEEYFRKRHEMQGRSRLIYKDCSVVSVLANLLRARLALGFYSMVGNERKKYRAKGRVFHYGAMLDSRVRSASEKPNALSADSSAAVSLDKGDLL
jgi:cellulose synthase/poly-beta-1,6-N-acetylglucosamine synthase-like glycosyltransferase